MKIAVIGAGVVGTATGLGLDRFGHEVSFGDISAPALEKVAEGHSIWLFGQEPPPQADIYLVCTPEDAVPDVMKALALAQGDLVIRSSTLPGTTEALAGLMGRPIFHNPEFLREATALDDFLNSRFTLIGRAGGAGGTKLESAYRQMGIRIVWTSATMSELVKLAINNYLATLISYWNQVHLLCDKVGVNSHNLARLATQDPRVEHYGAYKHGEAYGGACLPKDLDRMLGFYREKGVEPVLLEAVKAVNLSLGGVC